MNFEANIRQTWDLVYAPGCAVEIRAFLKTSAKVGGKFSNIVSGYFDNYDAFRAAAMEAEKLKPSAAYVTLNPVKHDLTARAYNRLIGMDNKAPTTSDKDIIGRRLVLIDADPLRPSGISSTDPELAAALAVRDEVAAYLHGLGFPPLKPGMSGNGGHLLGRIDLPNDEQSEGIVKDFLQCLDWKFGRGRVGATVGIDTTVYNAARITKLYGTTARKGDSTPTRPHRDSYLSPISGQIDVIPVELLQRVADEYRVHKAATTAPTTTKPVTSTTAPPNWSDSVDGVERYLADHGVSLQAAESYSADGYQYKWVVDCVTSGGAHKDGAVVMWGAGKGLGYKCHHDSCNGKGWADVRAIIDPKQPAPAPDEDWRLGFSPIHMAIELDGAAPTVTTQHRSYPYLIRDGRLVLLKEVKTKDGDTETISQPIADFTATIAETVVTEYGDQVFIVRGVGVRGGPFEVEVPAQDFGNTARLKGYLDAVSAFDGIYPKMTDHLGPAIKRLTLATTTRRRFHRTGWDKGKFLIPGREAAGAEIVLSEKAQLAYKLVPTANPALAVEALQSLMEGIGQYSTIYVAYALTGPLAALAGLSSEKYGLFARGITGSMKTTCTQLSMALWGPAFVRDQVYEKVGEFGATINGMIGRAAELCDLPFMADNFKPNTQGKESIVAFIHGIMEGFTKSRQTRAGFNARSYQLRAWPMMTGEDIPGSDTAALARLIVLDMESRAGTPQPAISRTQEIGEHLNAIGAAWLDVLEGPQGAVIAETFKATFLQYRDLFAEHIRNYSPKAENILRSASNFALNYAAWVALKQLPLIADIVASREAAHMETLFALAGDVGKHTADSLEYNRFLAILQELIVTRRVYLRPIGEVEAPLGVPVVGWYEAGCICFYANLVRKAVEDVDRNVLNGISNTALYKQLAHANLLIPGKDGESSQTRYDPATGKAARAVVLRHEAFDNGALDPRHALAKELGL